MPEQNYKQRSADHSEVIDITTDSHIWGTPSNERELAQLVLRDFAKYAQKTSGWSGFKLYNRNYYDDTDGSGMHANRPGVEATLEALATSGQVYRARIEIDEEAHNPSERRELYEPSDDNQWVDEELEGRGE